jgi:hypothetical protein
MAFEAGPNPMGASGAIRSHSVMAGFSPAIHDHPRHGPTFVMNSLQSPGAVAAENA